MRSRPCVGEVAELGDAGDAGGEAAADHRGDGRRAAVLRDVVDLEHVGALVLGDQRKQDVVDAAGRAAADRDRAGIRLQRLDEIADGLVGRVRRDGDARYSLVRRAIGVVWSRRDRRIVERDAAHHDGAHEDQAVVVAVVAS